MTQSEREDLIRYSGILEGMAMMILPICDTNMYIANQVMDISQDLMMLAKGVDGVDLGKRETEKAD